MRHSGYLFISKLRQIEIFRKFGTLKLFLAKLQRNCPNVYILPMGMAKKTGEFTEMTIKFM
jgi:hypothetical protein